MAQVSLYQQVLDYANRANPYPLYARLRETPIVQDPNGTYVVSTYRNIVPLLHDPRVSSDARNRPKGQGGTIQAAARAGQSPAFLNLDPPQHDTMRRQAMWQFGPPHTPDRIDALRPMLEQLANSLVDAFQGKTQVDIVEEFSYPLPVTAICRLLGVPREDEARFHKWADALVMALDPTPIKNPLIRFKDRVEEIGAVKGLGQYMAELVAKHRKQPGDDMLSGFVTDPSPDGPMSDADMVATGRLLLIAGHETTVNLITNGTLTLLRHPDILERLRREPELSVQLVEELLRYEPPVQIVPNRTAMADIELPDGTIPKGSAIALMLAAGNRDPARFPDPERFNPDREDIEHLAFGSGVHSCFGAPLARLEGQIALTTLARRLQKPRLVVDPPPYRPNPVLRGPRHLQVAFDGITA